MFNSTRVGRVKLMGVKDDAMYLSELRTTYQSRHCEVIERRLHRPPRGARIPGLQLRFHLPADLERRRHQNVFVCMGKHNGESIQGKRRANPLR